MLTTNWFESILCQVPNYSMLPQGRAKYQQELAGISTIVMIFLWAKIYQLYLYFSIFFITYYHWDVCMSNSSSVPRYISQLHFFLRLRLCSHWLNSLAHRLTTTVIILWLGIWTLLPIWWCQCRIRGCQIGVQGPHLWAKPRHFCNLDLTTSQQNFLDLRLHVLQLASSNSQNWGRFVVQNCTSDTPSIYVWL